MSIFVNLDSIKQTLTNRVETPKFILDENSKNVKEIAISVEYIAKPITQDCCTNQADWAITKDVYYIGIEGQTENIGSSVLRYDDQQPFHKQNKFRSFLHKTPIAVLFSESKSEEQETKNKQTKLPLYSSQCKINILMYAIESQNDKFGLESSRTILKPESRIQLGRDQLLDMIRELKNKSSNSRIVNSRLQRSEVQLAKKYDDYEIALKKIVNSEDNIFQSRNSLVNKKSYENYSCILHHQIKIERRFHLIQFCFVLSVQRFQECAGYLRAGFAKKVNFGESNLRFSHNKNERPDIDKLNNLSRYSIEDKKQRNFNFNLDFSGQKTKDHSRATQKLQSNRRRRQIHNPTTSKASSTSFFDWLCCNSNKNAHNDGEIQIDSEQILSMNSSQLRQEQRKVINLKRVDLHLGPCKTKNLFSMLDKGSHRRTFSLVQDHY